MRKKNYRQKKIKERKNFLSSFILTMFLWIILAGIVVFVDPHLNWSLPVFYISLFVTCLFTFSLLFKNSRRGLIVSLLVTLFLLLRFFGIGNIINLILLIGLAITVEVFFSKK